MPSAIVIGAGGIGVASAYFLNESGWDVSVVDQGEVGRGCSYGNSCLIVPSHSDPIPGPGVIGQAFKWMAKRDSPFYVRPRLDPALLEFFWRFRRYCDAGSAEHGYRALLGLSRGSLELYTELVESGDAEFFFERRGALEVFQTDEGLEHGRHAREMQVSAGFDAKLLTRDEALALEPALAPSIRGALFTEGEAHGFSYGYVRSLAATVEKRGGRFLTGRAVTRILTEGGKVRGVVVDGHEDELVADRVVLAAGSWSRALAKPIGVDIPLVPAKGYSCTIDNYDGAPSLPILNKERRVIVTPLDARLRFGGTLELTGFDETIDGARYDAVVRGGLEVLKTPPPMENEEAWSGLRPVTPDGLPVIDRPRGFDGLIVATGHAMLGFTQSPMTGKLVAELANGDAPSLPIEPFRLDRF
jgi:D-amino-acid dehydrogenase